MAYKVYKLEFTTGVHFGKRSIEDAEYSLAADTIFSALCHEFIKQGQEVLDDFIHKVKEGKLKLSDAFPYIGDTYYLPKPMWHVETQNDEGDSVIKKAYKNLKYIPAEQFDNYMKGCLDVLGEEEKMQQGLGSSCLKVSASIRGEEETVPYHIGVYYFKEKSGLYFIVYYEEEEDLWLLEDCLEALSFAGIGGRRTSGLGRFELNSDHGKFPKEILEKLDVTTGKVYMSLSVGLPREEELDGAIEGARFSLIKRSGFIASQNYASTLQRKKDMYMLKSGACFENRYEGDVYDVSTGEERGHAVYRYGKPLFMEVIS